MLSLKLFNLDLVKVAQEARVEFQASIDAWYEMKNMIRDIRDLELIFSSAAYAAMRDEWFSSRERGIELASYIKGYFGSLKWRAA